ncbi:MAG: DUF4350 domain-containing protein [Candidatus Dadabacteria bacterium]|nr:MAG: DUF4350 domain-containing protein [Candidatus Dadabacteria bacterium]
MKRRHVFLLIVIIVLWLFVSLFSSEHAGTSFSYRPTGSHAIFELYSRLGKNPRRFLKPFSELPFETRSALLVISPESTPGYLDSVLSWVKRGNKLLIFESLSGATTVLRKKVGLGGTSDKPLRNVILHHEEKRAGVSCPLKFFKACRGVKYISTPGHSFTTIHSNWRVLAGDQSAAYLAARQYGSGELWWFGGPEPVINTNIDRHDNLRLIYQILEDSSGIYFDEFHHGYRAPLGGKRKRDWQVVIWTVILLTIALTVGMFSRMIRFGPPIPKPKTPPSASVEFAVAFGMLCREKGRPAIIARYLESWRERVQATHGISSRFSTQQMVEMLHERGIVDNALAQRILIAIKRIESYAQERGPVPGDSDFVTIEKVFESSGDKAVINI